MLINKKTASCEDIRELMFDYIDGAPSDSDAAAFEAHIAECEACRRELAERREMLALVKASAAAAPSALYGRVMAEVEKTPQDKKILTPRLRVKPWMGSLAAVAAAVMILVVGRGFLSQSTEMLDAEPDAARAGSADTCAPTDEDISANTNTFAPDKVQYVNENVYGSSADDRIVETTDSYSGFAPALPAGTPNEAGRSDGQSAPETADFAVLDTLFAAYKSEQSALLVCTKADLDGVIPATECKALTIEDIACEYYVIEADAIVMFTGYLEVLEYRGANYRAHVPTSAEFEKCEIILVVDGDTYED